MIGDIMPYSSPEDLHENLQQILPKHAQEIYVAAFNNALKEYGTEDAARKVAWSAVKHKYKKGSGRKWVLK